MKLPFKKEKSLEAHQLIALSVGINLNKQSSDHLLDNDYCIY